MEIIEQREELAKAYEPKEVEDRTYKFWMERGYFTPGIDRSKKPFVIIMPPPNVTGELHVGHALTATLEDTMTRWHRMKGEAALWLPGVDHAGIATQVVVERQLAKEGLSRHDLGRERFLERVWQWISTCRGTIMDQHKKLGVSCDWSRDRFTLDEKPSLAVATTFVRLYNKGLIYRERRIVNWCPRCQTALSDLETEHKDTEGHLYYINYSVTGENAHITVATTRPETMFGDVAVAVNPEDKRFSALIGKKVSIPVIDRTIPIIADEAVELGFGTGALKITPVHDPVDFEVAQRHKLPMVNVLNYDASLNHEAGPYEGLDRYKAREALLAQLQREGLLVKTEKHLHAIGHCTRCDTVVEPWAMKQWFVKTKTLAEPAIQAVKDGRITIIPEHFNKVYLHWMENITDWCISRQLWWGHRIPVWYCTRCDGDKIYIRLRSDLTVKKGLPSLLYQYSVIDKKPNINGSGLFSYEEVVNNLVELRTEMGARPIVSVDIPKRCPNCSNENLLQDPDVLDTWFSSALWPHSTLGWPEETEDFNYFYPTTVMETGYDILFFWVARMIMMGLENTGKIPFSTVYLHGLIRDDKGEKMSKVRGNVINPLDAIGEFGADALRFAITTGSAPGNDIRMSSQKLEAARNFANKLWNAARFVMRGLPQTPVAEPPFKDITDVEDRWILSRLDQLIARVSHLLEDFQFGEAERQIHDFIWKEFCDWYIELAKIRLNNQSSPSPAPILLKTLETSLRLLHPFMPFITEEIWQKLVHYMPQDKTRPDSLMVAPYPVAEGITDTRAEEEMELITEIVRSIRNAKTESKIDTSQWIEARIYTDLAATVESNRRAIETLARVRPLSIFTYGEEKHSEGDHVVLLKSARVVLPMTVDLEAEKQRLEKEKETFTAKIAGLKARLSDSAFLSKAPASVVEKEKIKLLDFQGRLDKLEERLAQLR